MRLPGLGGWSDDPLWATFYDWSVEHPRAGGALWRLGIASDLRRLYAAAAEIGRQPAGSAVLDLPCGGGVALRGLRPGQGVRYVAADIAPTMLDRTMAAARERGVADQVEPRVADAGALPFDDGEFDLVVSFTGLHCFPDPHRAVLEMGRVTQSGGVLTGSAMLNIPPLARGGLRTLPVRRVGRLAGLLGPSATAEEVRRWLGEAGFAQVTLEMSGAMGYFRGVRT
ncbi:class I SAM-dependent methyltransferase [Nocardioides pocheonensis]|uniref:Class I SAM-dependent methyltransferase n=1 Tax=Nocardioides pocheonensis TaxID=661485 RepID=A0A3N0GWB6_9ACTN|nr:class I SAM-dependent methyltransferase [Nocardioides pocheonensis]RNM16755.1 class I SAM-dependent methyltransferase [Nocardioides pocheonensis]